MIRFYKDNCGWHILIDDITMGQSYETLEQAKEAATTKYYWEGENNDY